VNPLKYDSIFSGLSTLVKEQGPMSLWRGWTGKLFGYGFQGGCRFGLYEYFKKKYSDVFMGQKNRSTVYFVSSASAQVFADIALCPFESVKVRVQTQPMFAKGLIDGFPRVYASEGLFGLVTYF
jgi:solute carrier family 25 (mitochondrial phosphate transporter), member 3